MSVLRRHYGAGPLHLAGHLLLIALVAYLLSTLFEARFAPEPLNLVLWLLGGAVLHDAVILPAYSALNIAVAQLLGARQAAGDSSTPPTSRDLQRPVAILPHLRTPAVVSAVLLAVFFPRILNQQPQNFERALGYAPPDYLERWLLVTAGAFALSALIFAARSVRARRQLPSSSDQPAG